MAGKDGASTTGGGGNAEQISLKDMGNEFFKAGNYLKAAALDTQAIKLDPSNPVLFSNRAAAFLHLVKLTKALADAETAITLNPQWEKGYFRKGCILEAMERYDDEGDEVRRNLDVVEILKNTRFPRVHGPADERSPETILQHDRIIWPGDLNYRIALSYRTAKALVEMQNWRALLGNDQLRVEQKYGPVFVGWKEGEIYFPPMYKYSTNSDQFSGDGLYPKEKRRTPAWCDRILWYGEGLHQLSYVRGGSRFSDHGPVCGVLWAEVESEPDRLKKSASFSGSRITAEELLPYSHAYRELNFF